MAKIKWTSYLACAYAEGFCEGEGATQEEQIAAFQYLINTGEVWKLQGWYGRTAAALIEQGLCVHAKDKSMTDAYGQNVAKNIKVREVQND